MKFDLNNAGSRRGAVVAAGAALALAAGMGMAHATPQDINSTTLKSHHRAWDLTSDAFSVSDGAISYNRTGDDAFDGGLILYVDGTAFGDANGMGNYNASNESIKVGPTTLSGLKVSRTEKAGGAYDRSLVRLSNPTHSAIKTTLEWYSNLGSDGSGIVQSTSNGASGSWTTSDRWMVTSEPGANADGDDPTIAFVLYGKGAAVQPSDILLRPSSGETSAQYKVRVPAGETRYLLFYTEMWDNPKHAKKSMAQYDDKNLSSSLLSGISNKVQGKIVNWSL